MNVTRDNNLVLESSGKGTATDNPGLVKRPPSSDTGGFLMPSAKFGPDEKTTDDSGEQTILSSEICWNSNPHWGRRYDGLPVTRRFHALYP